MPFDFNIEVIPSHSPAVLEAKAPSILMETINYAKERILSNFQTELPQAQVEQFFRAYEEANWDEVEARRQTLLADKERLFRNPMLGPEPSTFAKSVWEMVARIPRGEVTTYGAIARKLNPLRPPAALAVGTAVGNNPLPILIPCHRVVTSQGKLGNYTFSSVAKFALLSFEGITFSPGSRRRNTEDDDVLFDKLTIVNPRYAQL